MGSINILEDKSLKPKEKTEQLAMGLKSGAISIQDLIRHAASAKDSEKASCIEAIEHLTKQNPQKATIDVLNFIISNLTSKSPRVKWESARVIENTAGHFKKHVHKAIPALIANSEDKGTVVRWSAARALSEIFSLNTKFNKDLSSFFRDALKKEEKNSIRKIYLNALKSNS